MIIGTYTHTVTTGERGKNDDIYVIQVKTRNPLIRLGHL